MVCELMHLFCPLGSEASTSTKGLMSDTVPPNAPSEQLLATQRRRTYIFIKGYCHDCFLCSLKCDFTSDVQTAGGQNWALNCYLHALRACYYRDKHLFLRHFLVLYH